VSAGRVWVVGSVNADLIVRTERLPGRGETVAGSGVAHGLGGKGANQAVAAARMGAEVHFVGAVGDDAEAAQLAATLAAEGIDLAHLARVPGPSGLAVVLVERSGENSIVVVAGANARVAVDLRAAGVGVGDVVVAQGELPPTVTVEALAAARDLGATTVWNPAPVSPTDRRHVGLADVLVVNETELALLSGSDDVDAGIAALAADLDGDVVATLGPDGVVARVDGRRLQVPVRSVEVVDTTGAGDCFVGVLAASLAAGGSLGEAIRLAVVASSIAVGRPGAAPSMPTAAEVASATSPS
jgi:ribokinase